VLVAIAMLAIFSIFSLTIILNIDRSMLKLKNAVILDIELSHIVAQIHSFVDISTIEDSIGFSDSLTRISIQESPLATNGIYFYTITATRLDYSKTIEAVQIAQQ